MGLAASYQNRHVGVKLKNLPSQKFFMRDKSRLRQTNIDNDKERQELLERLAQWRGSSKSNLPTSQLKVVEKLYNDWWMKRIAPKGEQSTLFIKKSGKTIDDRVDDIPQSQNSSSSNSYSSDNYAHHEQQQSLLNGRILYELQFSNWKNQRESRARPRRTITDLALSMRRKGKKRIQYDIDPNNRRQFSFRFEELYHAFVTSLPNWLAADEKNEKLFDRLTDDDFRELAKITLHDRLRHELYDKTMIPKVCDSYGFNPDAVYKALFEQLCQNPPEIPKYIVDFAKPFP